MQTQPTTPFGRRPLSLAMVASQAATEAFRVKPNAPERVVHKWRLFRALTEAKEPLDVTDRALSVLHALLSFHQETALTLPPIETKASEGDPASPGLVVFPSNKELSIRAHGMAPATLRRHLACLVDAGLIIRYFYRRHPAIVRFVRLTDRYFERPIAAVASGVQSQVGGDTEHPGRELGAGLVLLPRAIHAQKHFLGQVLRGRLIANHAVEEMDQGSPVAME